MLSFNQIRAKKHLNQLISSFFSTIWGWGVVWHRSDDMSQILYLPRLSWKVSILSGTNWVMFLKSWKENELGNSWNYPAPASVMVSLLLSHCIMETNSKGTRFLVAYTEADDFIDLIITTLPELGVKIQTLAPRISGSFFSKKIIENRIIFEIFDENTIRNVVSLLGLKYQPEEKFYIVSA